MNQKDLLREEYLTRRLGLSDYKQQIWSLAIINLLYDFILEHSFSCVSGYMSTKNEPNLLPLYLELQAQGVSFVFPKSDSNGYQMALVHHFKNDFMIGKFGVKEPVDHCDICLPEQVDCWLVPGLLFDKRGYRLGYGKGVYDELLKEVDTFKCGIAYDFQVTDRLMDDSWDEKLTHVFTNQEIQVFD